MKTWSKSAKYYIAQKRVCPNKLMTDDSNRVSDGENNEVLEEVFIEVSKITSCANEGPQNGRMTRRRMSPDGWIIDDA